MTTARAWVDAARALALDAVAIDVVAILRDAGVDALLLKGPVTATRLYRDEPDARDYCDVDLLVAPADFDRARDALAEHRYQNTNLGMRTSETGGREATWLAPGADRLPIDLHRSLACVGDANALWRLLWSERTTLLLQGDAVSVPEIAGTALIVALHASSPGSTRKPFRDLARAVAVLDDVTWSRATELARRTGSLTGMTLGFDAVHSARPLVMRFGLSTNASTGLLMTGYGASPAGLAIGNLLQAGGPGAQLRRVTDRAFPSTAFMHKFWPASRSGRGALVRAYVERLVALARSMPAGLRELRRARLLGRR